MGKGSWTGCEPAGLSWWCRRRGWGGGGGGGIQYGQITTDVHSAPFYRRGSLSRELQRAYYTKKRKQEKYARARVRTRAHTHTHTHVCVFVCVCV